MKSNPYFIIANWKMNPGTVKESQAIFNTVVKANKGIKNNLIICPPYPFLFIGNNLKLKNISLGAQDVFEELDGAYTGEVSPKMLLSLGVKYVILGHSERRFLGDTNQIINTKILTTLKSKLKPILCIGEKTRDHNGFYLAFVKHQLIECLSEVPKAQVKNIIFAYEPVWAIGSKSLREATPEEFVEMKIFIKKIIADIYDLKTASLAKVIYGGSVNSLNAKNFIEASADGLLVGRDSLNPKKFQEIIKTIN
jgi:triosephosphate isomerase